MNENKEKWWKKELAEVNWNYDPELGDFLSRKGVEDIISTLLEEQRVKIREEIAEHSAKYPRANIHNDILSLPSLTQPKQ